MRRRYLHRSIPQKETKMQRSDINEIKKLFSGYIEGESAAGMMSSCRITAEGKIEQLNSEKFLRADKSVKLKVYPLIKKIYTNNNILVQFEKKDKEKDGIQYLLDKVNDTDLSNEGLLKILYEKIAGQLNGNEGFTIILLRYDYDIPVRDKNKEKQKSDSGDGVYGVESDETYKFFVCLVCPLKTAKETLCYDKKVTICKPIKNIDNPIFGFAYPAFSDRSTDKDSVMCFDASGNDIAGGLFGNKTTGIDEPVKAKARSDEDRRSQIKKTKEESDKATQNITEQEKSFSLKNDYGTEAVSSYPVEETTDEIPDPVSKTNIGNTSPKTEKRSRIKIYGDTKKVSKRILDGKEYYIVPVSDAELKEGETGYE